ncbi:MAG: glycosyltransferase family 39 protein, partial [Chloroflexia bacterium]
GSSFVFRPSSPMDAFRSPDRLVWVALLLGAVLRLYNLTGMGLWIDEGYTIMFGRMSWADVLGLNGAYDSHPPLYFASAKLFGLIVPELAAGRVVSFVCGTLTLPVLYLLARRLAGGWIALAATFVLAISPLHIWYSQEARMYVPSMLFVAVSHWALVECQHAPHRKWAIIYGLSVLVAMYFSYSSLYALAPQAVLLIWLLRKHRREALPVFIALAAAIAAYLPWVPQWFSAIEEADPLRVTYLGVTPQKVGTQLLEITGLADRGFYLSPSALPWERRPAFYWIAGLSAMLVALAGGAVLAKHSSRALILALVLWAGTVLTAIALSLISPGFASRTTLYALLGWSLLAGAALVGIKRASRWVRAMGIAGSALVILYSLVSLGLVYTRAYKQDWASLANDMASVAPGAQDVLIVRPIDSTIIDAYHPGVLDGHIVEDPAYVTGDQVWFPYHDTPRFAPYHEQLRALGYERVRHQYYYNPLYLDLYAR